MNIRIILAAAAATILAGCSSLKDGEYNLSLVTTGDGHGSWFSKPFSDKGSARGSLMDQSQYVTDLRAEKGEDNVILVDAGDNFLGSNATFYYDYVDTLSPYLYPKLAAYMKYDAVIAGHCDFEAGHGVYDRVAEGFRKEGIPFLAGNVVRTDNGKRYFRTGTIVKKNGVKVAILGYTNADNSALMDRSAYTGLEFKSLTPLVQGDVDAFRKKYKPQVVVVVAHTAIGKGEGNNTEKQGLDLFESLRGVDFLVTAHDHSNKVMKRDSIVLMSSGKSGQYAGYGEVKLVVKGGKVISRELDAKSVSISRDKTDTAMESAFKDEFDAVKAFSCSKIGSVKKDLVSREFYSGQCDYLNFLHALALTYCPMDISLTSTLLIDGKISAGDVTFNDLKTLYPYGNKLVVLKLSGEEIKRYLEASYDLWIETVSGPEADHILRIKLSKDWGSGQMVWKLAKSPANFDSAAGIDYTVDVTKPYGERVNIQGMSDGSPFEMNKMYSVGITSYRSTGAGGLLKAAGLLSAEEVESRTIFKGPEFRTILYEYFQKNGSIDPTLIGKKELVGRWKFVPEGVREAIQKDVEVCY